MLERSQVTKIQRWLRANFPGCYLIKLESPSTSGILDIYFAYGGRSIWFEVKRAGLKKWENKAIQEWHQKQLNRNGIEAHFIFSLDDVKNVMKTKYEFVPHLSRN